MDRLRPSEAQALAGPPSTGYLVAVAGLSPLALNAAVGLQPAFDGTPLSPAQQGATVALLVLGLGLGQPLAGDAADRFGRRPATIGGLVLALGGAAMATVATGPGALLWGRFALGLGLATVLVVPRTCMRDAYAGAALQRAMAVLAIVFSIVPALTPALAWALADAVSWRAPMAGVALLVLAATIGAAAVHTETRPASTRAPSASAWWQVLRHPGVLRTAFTFAAMAAPFFIFAANAPAALRQSTAASNGTIALVLGLSYLGFALGNYWVRRRAADASSRLVTAGVAIATTGTFLAVGTLAFPYLALWLAALAIHAVGHGIVFPAAFALVLQDLPRQAGLTTAVVGTIHMSTGAVAAWTAGALASGTLDPHASTVGTALALTSLGCLAWFGPGAHSLKEPS